MKPIRISRRWLVLSLLLLMSVAAAVAVSRDQAAAGVVTVAERSSASAAVAGTAERPRERADMFSAGTDQLARLNARRIEEDLEPLFQGARKAAAVRRASVEEAPSAPVAPPLPFRFLGRMVDEGKATLFLSMNERNIVVSAGETIDGLYRVDSIENGVAVFTYLPMKQKQTLPIGEKS